MPQGLGSSDLVPPAGGPDSHLSWDSQGKGSSGRRCSGGVAMGVGRLLPGLRQFLLGGGKADTLLYTTEHFF